MAFVFDGLCGGFEHHSKSDDVRACNLEVAAGSIVADKRHCCAHGRKCVFWQGGGVCSRNLLPSLQMSLELEELLFLCSFWHSNWASCSKVLNLEYLPALGVDSSSQILQTVSSCETLPC